MSYARFGWGGSDVYVYFHVGDFLHCCGCCLPGMNYSFSAYSTQEMVDHLQEHVASGHCVPDSVIPDLLEDDKENFPKNGDG